MIAWMMRHETFYIYGGWQCWACGEGGVSEEGRWEHEDAHEGETVEFPFEDQRVTDHINYMFEVEDSEIEAAEEIQKSSGPEV